MGKAKHAANQSATHVTTGHAAADHVALGHDVTEVNTPWTIFSAAVVGLTVIGCCLVGRWLFGELLEPADMRSNTSATGEGLMLPLQPRLEGIDMMSAATQTETAFLSPLQMEQAQLQTYGWVNKDQRAVRIPIRRAMEIVLQQGLPTNLSSPPANSAAATSAAATKITSSKAAAEQSEHNLSGPRLSNPGNAPDENR